MSSYIIKSELKLPKTVYHSVSSFIIDRLKAWYEDIILVSNYSNKSILIIKIKIVSKNALVN
jgi:hypothetical protein